MLSFLEDVALLTNQEEENRDVDPTGGQVRLDYQNRIKQSGKNIYYTMR